MLIMHILCAFGKPFKYSYTKLSHVIFDIRKNIKNIILVGQKLTKMIQKILVLLVNN